MGKSRYRAVKAYRNEEFMNSRDARSLRILSEYVEPESRFREFGIQDTIIIFGSARLCSQEDAEKGLIKAKEEGGDVAAAERILRNSKYYEATRDLSERLTHWSKGLEGTERRFVICSGGGPGIMEAAKETLDTDIGSLLTETQQAEWKEKTARRQRGGRGGLGGGRGRGDVRGSDAGPPRGGRGGNRDRP